MYNLTVETFLPWLAQEADNLAINTSSGGDPFPYLWAIATDAHDWLQQISEEDKQQVLRQIQQCLDVGFINEVKVPEDKYQAKCFVTLLQWVISPPKVL